MNTFYQEEAAIYALPIVRYVAQLKSAFYAMVDTMFKETTAIPARITVAHATPFQIVLHAKTVIILVINQALVVNPVRLAAVIVPLFINAKCVLMDIISNIISLNKQIFVIFAFLFAVPVKHLDACHAIRRTIIMGNYALAALLAVVSAQNLEILTFLLLLPQTIQRAK